jgi:hypothetical protein
MDNLKVFAWIYFGHTYMAMAEDEQQAATLILECQTHLLSKITAFTVITLLPVVVYDIKPMVLYAK